MENETNEVKEVIMPEEKPRLGRPPKAEGELANLRGLVESMQSQISEMKQYPQGKNRLQRKRTKEHFVTLRQLDLDNELRGIVLKVYNVREVKDRTEAKRFMGLCSVDYIDLDSGKKETALDVDYLRFLNDATRVQAAILAEKNEERFEVDPRKGGGGIGALYKQGPNDEYMVESEYEFAVGYVDQTFTLKILEGKWEGKVIEVGKFACNI